MITLVSGLPRSGTSMMMQLLAAGGMQLLTDDIRTSDVDNPKGYFEFEPVKKLKTDSSWMGHAEGKVVKIIAQLLTSLPNPYEYKVVFMHRKLEEVLQSQEVMLKRRGKSGAGLAREQLGRIFERQLTQVKAFLNAQANIQTFEVDYAQMVQQPDTCLIQLKEFLNVPLDIEAMKSVVDPGLYRNRTG